MIVLVLMDLWIFMPTIRCFSVVVCGVVGGICVADCCGSVGGRGCLQVGGVL